MTARIVLEIPGDPVPQSLELAEGATIVVGREPIATRPDARPVTIAAPAVSAQHVSLQREHGVLTVIDERSRNGTWLKLPPGDRVVVQTEQPVVLRLGAAVADGAPTNDRPADAEWNGGDDFHVGVVRAIGDWFEQQRVPARVTALPHAEPGRDLPGLIPLANGFDLSVVPLRTMDHRWERMAATLWSYAGAQNLIFITEEHTRSEGLVLVSPSIRRVHRSVVEAARRGVRILLFGPSGAGKDGLARCYHRNSGRAGAFVAKNCSMFTREFLRVELFGAEKGAYTGSVRTVIGAVERAHDGTLFLDEIGEMPPEVQAMLLTFLDNGEYERVGGNGQVRTADVRVVSATNRDLRHASSSHTLREDLWYRIAGQVIEVPPLCDRPEDVVAYLQVARLPSGISVHESLTPGARQRLLEHRWPGNFRELRSFVAQVAPDARAGSIDTDGCAVLLQRVSRSAPAGASPARPTAAPSSKIDIANLAKIAAQAFQADLAHDVACWDDVKQFVESYLKPLLFAALSGIRPGDQEVPDIAALAQLIDADRGTVRKHLGRFLERFGEPP